MPFLCKQNFGFIHEFVIPKTSMCNGKVSYLVIRLVVPCPGPPVTNWLLILGSVSLFLNLDFLICKLKREILIMTHLL